MKSAPSLLSLLDVKRLVQDTLDLVRIPSVTGNTAEVAQHYQRLLEEVGCRVERHEFYPGNPTLVATFGPPSEGKRLIFNGHMDVVPLPHTPAKIEGERLYGRGTCDMKGSLAAIIEVLRVIKQSDAKLNGQLMVIANSLHESPGGRGEDLLELTARYHYEADAVVVMEGASTECTVAQMGSATFRIDILREGEPSHQLHTPLGTPHPISVAAEVIQELDRRNAELAQQDIADIGTASYFVGSAHSGEFYNQMPNHACLDGVRRYGPEERFEEVERELRELLKPLADRNRIEIGVAMEKVRDGYRIDKDSPVVEAFVQAVQEISGQTVPKAGKKLVTDAGIFVNAWGIPALCHGPDQVSAHGETEFVEIRELERTAQVYLTFIGNYLGWSGGDADAAKG
ncbi:M20 family metallopeptidase [Paenibacillus sp. J2TS4]|uniref:M20 family metallopeptidase n=1 Tax=Paenibacillus sp. J2TS4 TaxID=2807194 RepID=UPI001B105FD7|nr:M20/M25/M40 family metallo-hydrolase [Paenibacillus sp. J2TS4]GIP33400.1 succinyl-diaminopimelate desuccinylase [Paenibacillus sp. J2TS4]